jgi:hypothetical protein
MVNYKNRHERQEKKKEKKKKKRRKNNEERIKEGGREWSGKNLRQLGLQDHHHHTT